MKKSAKHPTFCRNMTVRSMNIGKTLYPYYIKLSTTQKPMITSILSSFYHDDALFIGSAIGFPRFVYTLRCLNLI